MDKELEEKLKRLDIGEFGIKVSTTGLGDINKILKQILEKIDFRTNFILGHIEKKLDKIIELLDNINKKIK